MPYLRPLGALRTLRLQIRERLHSNLMTTYVHNLGGEDSMTQSGGVGGIDKDIVELMRVVYSREAKFGSRTPEGGSDDDEEEEDEEGAWDIGICKGWLAEVVEKWVGLQGNEWILPHSSFSSSTFFYFRKGYST
jgi:hypothetical protein